MTFCHTLMVRKSARFWNVRPMPSAAMRCGAVAVSGWPSNRMLPSLKLYRRERQLKSVVLPAPLGPMSPAIVPGRTANEIRSSAVMPPKRTVTPETSSKAADEGGVIAGEEGS